MTMDHVDPGRIRKKRVVKTLVDGLDGFFRAQTADVHFHTIRGAFTPLNARRREHRLRILSRANILDIIERHTHA